MMWCFRLVQIAVQMHSRVHDITLKREMFLASIGNRELQGSDLDALKELDADRDAIRGFNLSPMKAIGCRMGTNKAVCSAPMVLCGDVWSRQPRLGTAVAHG